MGGPGQGMGRAPEGVGGPGEHVGGSREGVDGPERASSLPGWLRTGAAWAWRLLLIGAALYVAARVAEVLYIVVVPCAAALLLTALLEPAVGRLRRMGLPSLVATWCTLIAAAAVLTGVGLLVSDRVSADYPELVAETKHTTQQVQSWLAGPPFRLKGR